MKIRIRKYHLKDVSMKTIPFICTLDTNINRHKILYSLADPDAPVITEIIRDTDMLSIIWNYEEYTQCTIGVKVDGSTVTPIAIESPTKIPTNGMANCQIYNLEIEVSPQSGFGSKLSDPMPTGKSTYYTLSQQSQRDSISNC